MARVFRRLVYANEIGDSNLRRHAQEAANSVMLNIGEGAGQSGAAKKRHYRIAYASAIEVVVAYEAALDSGQNVDVEELFERAQHIIAALTKLIRR